MRTPPPSIDNLLADARKLLDKVELLLRTEERFDQIAARVSARRKGSPDFGAAASLVAEEFGVLGYALFADSRPARLLTARQVLMYLCVKILGGNDSEVGRYIKKCRTTIPHGVATIRDRMDTEPKLKARVDRLAAKLREIKSAEVRE